MSCFKDLTTAQITPAEGNIGLYIPKGWGRANSDGPVFAVFTVDKPCQ